MKDTANSLQTFLILCRYSVVLLVIKLQRPTLHSNIKQDTIFISQTHKHQTDITEHVANDIFNH